MKKNYSVISLIYCEARRAKRLEGFTFSNQSSQWQRLIPVGFCATHLPEGLARNGNLSAIHRREPVLVSEITG